MTGLSRSPRLAKAGLVVIDPDTGAVQRRIVLQYNPDQLSRTLQLGEGGESGPLRTRTPPVETIRIEAELDAADLKEQTATNQDRPRLQSGVAPAIAALETLVYPRTRELHELEALASRGTLEILAPEPPLVLFVWSARRIVPVRITELAVTEEAFEPDLTPIRAKVTLGLRVLNVADLGMNHRGSGIYLVYQRNKEHFAKLAASGELPFFTLPRGVP
jgi:hypothetical protein